MDILSGLSVFMMFISLSALPAVLLFGQPYIAGLFAIPYALCFWMRRGLKHLSLFLLAHIALLFLSFLPGANIFQRIMYIALMLMIVIHSVVLRLNNKPPDISAAFAATQAVFACALAIAADRLQRPAAVYPQPVTVGVVIICYIIFQHIKNLDETLDLITRTTTQPVRSIFLVNNRIIAAFAAIAGAAALLSVFLKLDGAVMMLGKWLLALLRFIARLLSGKGGAEAPPAPAETPAEQQPPMMLPPADAKPWLIWVILEKIIFAAVIAAGIAGAIALVIYVCVRVYKRFYGAVKSDDEVEVIPHDNMAAEAIKALRAFFLPLSGVRRHFYKKIKRHMGKGVPIQPSDTPEDMARKITEEDIGRLTEDYQQVRYR